MFLKEFKALGIIKNTPIHSHQDINNLLTEFEDLFTSAQIEKSDIIQLLNKHLPDFSHIETGKSLDQKM